MNKPKMRRVRRGGGRRKTTPPGRYSNINVRFLAADADAYRRRAARLGITIAQLVESALRATEGMEFRAGEFVARAEPEKEPSGARTPEGGVEP